jgi:hypothetical protein
MCDDSWRPGGAQADVVATFNVKDMRHTGPQFGFQVLRPGPLLRRIRQ